MEEGAAAPLISAAASASSSSSAGAVAFDTVRMCPNVIDLIVYNAGIFACVCIGGREKCAWSFLFAHAVLDARRWARLYEHVLIGRGTASCDTQACCSGAISVFGGNSMRSTGSAMGAVYATTPLKAAVGGAWEFRCVCGCACCVCARVRVCVRVCVFASCFCERRARADIQKTRWGEAAVMGALHLRAARA